MNLCLFISGNQKIKNNGKLNMFFLESYFLKIKNINSWKS